MSLHKINTKIFSGFGCAAAAAAMLSFGIGRPDSAKAPATPASAPQTQAVQSDDRPVSPRTIRVFQAVMTADRVVLKPIMVKAPSNGDPLIAVVDEMAALQNSPLPVGTRGRIAKLDKNGVLRLDLNRAFVANVPGGSANEAMVVAALSAAYAQFPEIKALHVTVEGKPLESLGGHLEWSENFPVLTQLPEMFTIARTG